MNQPKVYICSLPLEPLSPPTPSHPSRLSQSTRFEFPASYSTISLAIYFTCGNVCILMLLSQFIPLSPSSSVSTILFSFSLDKHFGFTIAILFHWNYKISSKHKWVNKESEGIPRNW